MQYDTTTTNAPAPAAAPPPLNLRDLEAAARARLPRMFYDYYAGGAEDEVTLRANADAYRRIGLRPRVLVDVSTIDTRLELCGTVLAHPIVLAPTAFQRLAHPDGERATARAAQARETLLVASTLSTCTIEETAEAGGGPLWFQLYVFRDRALTRSIVQRAEAAGVRALCLTVTVPVQGIRERDARNGFRLPDGLEMANFTGYLEANFPDARGSGLEAFIGSVFDASLDWNVLVWLRSITDLPILIKGVTHPDDARLAVENGADGIIVSNHGGRQLDGAEPTCTALPRVADAVAGAIPVLVDGGIRRGSDVVKALALGARAVLVGRPYLWGLAVDGQAGVERVIDYLRGGLERTMALAGRTTLAALDRDLLVELPSASEPQRLEQVGAVDATSRRC